MVPHDPASYHPAPASDPSPGGQHTHATVPAALSPTPTSTPAGVTQTPVFVPTVFRQPCERCGHENVWPFDPVLSAQLDALLIAEERIQALTQAAQEDAP